MLHENPLQNLFDRDTLEAMARKSIAHLTQEIENISDEEVPKRLTDVEACVADAIHRFAIDIPVLRRGDIVFEMSDKPGQLILEDTVGFRRTVAAHHYDFDVPFDGNAVYFEAMPVGGLSSPLQGGISHAGAALLINIALPLTHGDEGLAAQTAFNARLDAIDQVLGRLRVEAAALKVRVEREFRAAIDTRLERYSANQARARSLGYRLKKHPNAPVIPLERKRVTARPAAPKAQPVGRQAAPVLADQSYEDVLDIVTRMSLVMERNPSTFHKASENVIRDHFLVQLNGTFEGEALGGAFNQNGKTDILIRSGDNNIFVAECKIWRGEASFRKAIYQLLGYVSWRDTKAALLVFNRLHDSTAVLGKMDAAITEHESFVSKGGINRNAALRYRLRHPTDRHVEVTVTVMLFDVPAPVERAA